MMCLFLVAVLSVGAFANPAVDNYDNLPREHKPNDMTGTKDSGHFHLVHHVTVAATATGPIMSATADNVTAFFTLKATSASNNTAYHNYGVQLENNSNKNVCAVSMDVKDTHNLTNMKYSKTGGAIITEDLYLKPGSSAHQFAFTSTSLTSPSMLALTYCYDKDPVASARALINWVILPSILLIFAHWIRNFTWVYADFKFFPRRSKSPMFLFLLLLLPTFAFSVSPTDPNYDDPDYHSPAADYFQLVHHTEVNATLVGVDFTATVDGITMEFKHGAQSGVGVVFHGNIFILDCLQSLLQYCTNTSDYTNLVSTSDRYLMSKNLYLSPRASTRKFGYISSKQSRPTISRIMFKKLQNNGVAYHNYAVQLENKSSKNVCVVSMDVKDTQNLTNMKYSKTGALITEDLYLKPGSLAHHTIAVRFCIHHSRNSEWPNNSANALLNWMILQSIILFFD
ncbi:hypothetical protein PRIPAC_80691 [Pristionchus pacificus]|uniref:Uncharacterized protein n=1 Tax=Pristionchus pacificus TaxID=54126 RepID=A0A2A6BI75_PRIPA|nr:hypothetical protein PRIPAC_80691 [Pristionchus pacificus]|eukprot:PDM65538.1 hypothetical protein PRIPAC_52480 [Pristionchus pacificus]